MNWHYVENGQQMGPVDEARFQELIRTGKINDRTLVWRDGWADWIPYGKIQKAAGSYSGVIGENPEAVCAECGALFPIADMIRHGQSYICAGCKPVFMQKLSEGAPLPTGQLNYASVLTRFAAVFLDGLILGVINFGMMLAAGLNLAQSAGVQPHPFDALRLILLGIQMGIGISYETVMIGKFGATLGKMACNIKVVTADGGRVSYARALGRYFAKILSGMICLIGYLMAFFDKPQRRALHDRICNTRVINK